MEAIGDILVLPFYGQGHLFPCMELCKKFTSFNFKVTLIIPSHLSSSIPPHLRHHSLIQVVEISATSTPPPLHKAVELPALPPKQKGHGFMHGPFSHHHQQLGQGIDTFLSERRNGSGQTRPICAAVDVMMSWSKEIFVKYEIPFVSFFTSGACAAAMEFAAWKNHADEVKPGEIRILPGLPESMALSYSDIKRNRHGPGHHRGGGPNRQNEPSGPPGGVEDGPPKPGQKPRWLDEVEGSIALLINTCHDLEGPFIDYVANQIEKPLWGVGPLLPETYWKSTSSILHDHEVRSNRQSNFTEEKVMQWLNSKPQGSVIYVSFGSEVGPSLVEYAQLADALEASNHPFIWVIQAGSGRPGPPPVLFGDDQQEEGYYPNVLDERIGNKGLIIRGWAPQLLILSHPSTGGFLSHCGWNSTMEAIGRGIPILAWPIRGDQFHDAKLVANYLKMGHMILLSDDPGEMVKKDDIVQGIDKMMKDEGVHKQAMALRSIFQSDYPESSMCSLKSFIQLISK
ncbi:probable UDP-glucosyl transferase 73B6 [Nicotiana sylvestris]|uniref:Glycosyltransferase n=1 Tax=Nicotiana sylvestris TaxID=4096 RepID=A0A1U7XQL6_NICSY|nr:PREDICTED: UDP-glucosyl transferase 73B2-like [Nicotiana sylvestris]